MNIVIQIFLCVWIIHISASKQQRNIMQVCTDPYWISYLCSICIFGMLLFVSFCICVVDVYFTVYTFGKYIPFFNVQLVLRGMNGGLELVDINSAFSRFRLSRSVIRTKLSHSPNNSKDDSISEVPQEGLRYDTHTGFHICLWSVSLLCL